MRPVQRTTRKKKIEKFEPLPESAQDQLMCHKKAKLKEKDRKVLEAARVRDYRLEKKKDPIYQEELRKKERERKQKQRLKMKKDPEEIQLQRKRLDALRKKQKRMQGSCN